MTHAGKVVAKCVVRALERQLAPREVGGEWRGVLEAFVIDGETRRSPWRRDHDHRRAAAVE